MSRRTIILAFVPEEDFSSEGERNVFDYYENIKDQPHVQENPYFWLQYAITALNLKEYTLAKLFFEHAYAMADKMNEFDTYQLDTHYAFVG